MIFTRKLLSVSLLWTPASCSHNIPRAFRLWNVIAFSARNSVPDDSAHRVMVVIEKSHASNGSVPALFYAKLISF